MKDEEDEGDSESGDENDDNDTRLGRDEDSAEEVKKDPPKKRKKPKTKKPKKKGCRRNPVSRRGRTGIEKPRGIIDPGTEIDVIGGPGWHVISQIDNMNAQLDGALVGMGERTLPLVRAVTA
jgi:hypothetical protein